jgi:lysophospholipase L1-like esterase
MRRPRFIGLLLAALWSPANGGAGQTSIVKPAIEWRIEAGFAPLAHLAAPAAASTKWLPAVDTSGTIESFEQWYRRTSTAGESPYVEFLDSNRNPWNAALGRYRQDYADPQRTVILARMPGAGPECRWTVTGTNASPMVSAPVPCDAWSRTEAPITGGRLSVVAGDLSDSTPLNIDHKVVVALGDSYGSGEGNPDVPTRWKPKSAPPGSYSWLRDPEKKGSLIESGARWWDTSCHRSFWSHQTYVALRLAAENTHRLVTYLHYSCSAAEIFDGVMVRQRNPPGMEDCSGSRCILPASQIAATVRNLCRGQVLAASPVITAISREVNAVANAPNKKLYFMDTYAKIGLDLAQCAGELRTPDLVLLSIGGNDIGFGALAGWAVVPPEARNPIAKTLGLFRHFRGLRVTCPEKALQRGCKKPYDSHLINQLGRRFKLMGRALSELTHVVPANVVITGYPDPLRDRSGRVCGDPPGTRLDSPWSGGHSKLPLGEDDWDFNILRDEASILSTYTLPSLRQAIQNAASHEGFTSADATADVFLGHCWTESDPGDSSTALPSATPQHWSCPGLPTGSPACWQPFAPRRRFIRTINDALLTQSSERDDDMTGAVHPTAQGHAAVAEAVMNAVRTTPSFRSFP